ACRCGRRRQWCPTLVAELAIGLDRHPAVRAGCDERHAALATKSRSLAVLCQAPGTVHVGIFRKWPVGSGDRGPEELVNCRPEGSASVTIARRSVLVCRTLRVSGRRSRSVPACCSA